MEAVFRPWTLVVSQDKVFSQEQIGFRLPAVLVLGILVLLPSDGLGILLCPFNLLFDLPCPACGLTRSMSSLLHLQFAKSLFFHPLGGVVLFFLFTRLFTNEPDGLRLTLGLSQRVQVPVFTLRNVGILFMAVWFGRMGLSMRVL